MWIELEGVKGKGDWGWIEGGLAWRGWGDRGRIEGSWGLGDGIKYWRGLGRWVDVDRIGGD